MFAPKAAREPYDQGMPDDKPNSGPIGKRVTFDRATWIALDLYARDSMKSFQELADEAFADLLAKHNRPVDLKDALRRSARAIGANDNPKQKRGR